MSTLRDTMIFVEEYHEYIGEGGWGVFSSSGFSI